MCLMVPTSRLFLILCQNLKTSVNEKLNSDFFFQIDHFIYKAFLYEHIIKIRETV